MFIVYEPCDIVKLRRTYEYDDLDDWGLKEDELEALRAAEDEQLNAEIVGEETDGYYNIVVCYEDGTQRQLTLFVPTISLLPPMMLSLCLTSVSLQTVDLQPDLG